MHLHRTASRSVRTLALAIPLALVALACSGEDSTAGALPGTTSDTATSTSHASGGGFGGQGGTTTAGSGGAGGAGGTFTPPPSCDDDAKTGDYCGGDQVSNGDPNTLYRCEGPGAATVKEVCAHGCVVAPPGNDDFCSLGLPECPDKPLLKYGLAPEASDRLRCVGITADKVTQTIGSAPASAGTHAKDGTIDGVDYSAATDLSVKTLTNAQVKVLVDDLATHGFAAFFRDPGKDGWPSTEARHIHAIFVGVPMKDSLKAQVKDWLEGLNGLKSHAPYTFYQASPAQKAFIEELFKKANP
ncbi:MAG: hypothetical protein FJ096_21895 [Deltaproteobacteria bacterium]|nr:hypothetical protein [Deltaproteobacteria bacterium]